MARKVFDIIPPHLVGKKTTKSRERAAHKKIRKEKSKRSFRFGGIIVSSLALIVIACVFLYFKLASLSVIVWPATEDLNIQELVVASTGATAVDLATKTIPAQVILDEKELWQEFDATGSGSDEGLATGTIRVYNKYNPATTINLKTGTHFLSDSGKYFQSLSKIIIPAAQIKGGKITPGSVDVKVKAIEAGEDYNISASKFSIPKLAGTDLYYALYGESSTKMEGGYKSTSKVVTADDIENAKEALSDKLLADIDASLREKVSAEGLVAFNDALTKQVVETSASVKAGAQVEKFNYKVKVTGSVLTFKKADLDDLAHKDIAAQIATGRTLLEKSLVLNYVPAKVELATGRVSFNLQILSKTYPQVNKLELISKISRKDSTQIRDIIDSAFLGQVSQVRINFWPFWVTKGPTNQNKIKVDLIFE